MARVLVVEDDDDVREAMVELLDDRGYDVIAAGNGIEALEQMRTHQELGLVLLDLSMPVMDGWECCENMAKDPRLACVPVVLLSGTSSLEAERKELGAAAVLAKPFSPAALLATVERYTRRS